MPLGFVAAAVVGSQVVGSVMQADAAGRAADQYSQTAQKGLQYNQDMFNTINSQNAPYRALGEKGAMQYGNYIDNGYFTAQPSMNDLTRLMPNYEFGLKQGMGQFNAGINAAGGMVSGNAIQGGQQFAQGYAANSLNDAFNQYQVNRSNVASNLGFATNAGQNANTTTSNAATGASANASNMLSSIGNAQAAGTMGAANAYASGLSNLSNYAMLYGMKKMS